MDAEELAAVHVLCWREAHADILPMEFLADLSVSDRVKLWQHLISSPKVFKQVACVDGNIVGFTHAVNRLMALAWGLMAKFMRFMC